MSPSLPQDVPRPLFSTATLTPGFSCYAAAADREARPPQPSSHQTGPRGRNRPEHGARRLTTSREEPLRAQQSAIAPVKSCCWENKAPLLGTAGPLVPRAPRAASPSPSF